MKLPYMNKHSYDHTKRTYTVTDEKSMTVPNQAESIKDILARAIHGESPERKPIFYMEKAIEGVDMFLGKPIDLTGYDTLNERIDTLQKILDDNKSAAEAARIEEVKAAEKEALRQEILNESVEEATVVKSNPE